MAIWVGIFIAGKCTKTCAATFFLVRENIPESHFLPTACNYKYVQQQLPAVIASIPGGTAGKIFSKGDLTMALRDAWLIIEAIPERPDLKKGVRRARQTCGIRCHYCQWLILLSDKPVSGLCRARWTCIKCTLLLAAHTECNWYHGQRLMDKVGLDLLLDIENHYAAGNPHLPSGPRQFLHRYVDAGYLGVKTGRGLYKDYVWAQTLQSCFAIPYTCKMKACPL